MSKPRVIAFYLPQFHPIPENDTWWGKGFTEWTNVGKAKPLFRGHYQPRVPADLGYYDLRLSEVREAQAELARQNGIEGFCYWHYWFGGGKRLLELPLNEVLVLGKPDFPFCLCWANHSWQQKTWDSTHSNKMLIEQTYPGKTDYIAHFHAMLPVFQDKRYMKINGRLIFGIFAPLDLPDPQLFFDTWNEQAQLNGLNGFHFFGYVSVVSKMKLVQAQGFDSVVLDYLSTTLHDRSLLYRAISKIKREYMQIPRLTRYDDYVDCFLNQYKALPNEWPCLVPDFDHSPRSGTKGVIITGSTPKKWSKLCRNIFNATAHRSKEENLVFIKAWNEWGEGNYLEPDLKHGTQYLDALKIAISSTNQ